MTLPQQTWTPAGTRIRRDQWRERFCAEANADAHTRIDSSPGRVSVEFEDGRSYVDVYFSEEATDVRIGDLQFIVGRDRLSVLRQHPPYPIWEWTVIYDGPLPKREESS
jgi:hypothetical protein